MTLGGQSPYDSEQYSRFALALGEAGYWKEAEIFEVEMMESSLMLLGEERPSTLTTMGNLVSTYWYQGRWEEAEKLNVRVMESRKRLLGEDHHSTLTAGLTLNTTTGLISGIPTAAGTSNVPLTATNGGGSGTATLVVTIAPPDTNVALGKLSTASSFQGGNEVGKANDGSTTTRWAASDGTVPQWWMVDLGTSKTLSKVDINWYSNATRYSQYTIQTSIDNVNWTTVVNKSTNTITGPTSDTFNATARFVRVNISFTSSGFVSAYEIGVYGH